MAELKSLAHPAWPYAGTAHEWRGFVKDEAKPLAKPVSDLEFERVLSNAMARYPLTLNYLAESERRDAIYQKQNFGELD
jgi:hypothetical protein